MNRTEYSVGDEIEVIDTRYFMGPMIGKILELDLSIMGDDYARIKVESPAADTPEIWVNLRLARKRPE